MPRTFIVTFAALVASLSAQEAPKDPLAAAKARLQAALQKTAATTDTAFAAAWGEDSKPRAEAEQQPAARPNAVGGGALVASARPSVARGDVTGSWHASLVACKFQGGEGDEFVTAGRHTIARAGDGAWARRLARFADGHVADFRPDPELLLDQFAKWDLAVTHRETGSLDDHPVEIVSVTLTAEQIAEAAWSGLVPAQLTGNNAGSSAAAVLVAKHNGGPRPAPAMPTATVDVAIALDPGTNLVHGVHLRAWTKRSTAGQVALVRAGPGGAVQVAPRKDAAEETAEDPAKQGAPLQYENGLPVRPREKTVVLDFTVRLRDHGKSVAPALTLEQKKLLRL